MHVPAGYAVARLLWTVSGDLEPMIATLGLDVLSASSPTPAEVAALVSTAWQTSHPANTLHTTYTFRGTSVTFGPQPGDGPTAEDVESTVGTATGLPLPSNCALLVRKLTALGGRRNRGRMYLPAGYLAEAGVDQNGVIVEASRVIYEGRMDTFYSALVTPAPVLQPVVLHSDAAIDPTPITEFVVPSTIATQRKRMRP